MAILEYLSWSSYHYWGSYDIKDQNSSTNVTKSVHSPREFRSPAKVFTANNTPYFVNHLEKSASPTETFVRNYGPRLHHIAVAVRDGETDGMENIEFVVNVIRDQDKDFLLDVIGSKEQGLKQIFSRAAGHREGLREMEAQPSRQITFVSAAASALSSPYHPKTAGNEINLEYLHKPSAKLQLMLNLVHNEVFRSWFQVRHPAPGTTTAAAQA